MNWFSDEQPSEVVMGRVEERLMKENWKIDAVLSHTCPYKYIPRESFLPFIDQRTVDNSTERWLDSIEDKLEYDRWLCGHFHTSKTIGNIAFLYTEIIGFDDIF
jgi:3-oxoacid CoA-transferase subunit A